MSDIRKSDVPPVFEIAPDLMPDMTPTPELTGMGVGELHPEVLLQPVDMPGETNLGWASRARELVRRNKGKIALGAAAASATLTLTLNPLGQTEHELAQISPTVAEAVIASEALFIGGAAAMAIGVGSKVGNPFTLRKRLPELCERADNSLVFKAGFWANATGAIGTTAMIAGEVITHMPPDAYGLIAFAGFDLASTVALRRSMLHGIKERAALVADKQLEQKLPSEE